MSTPELKSELSKRLFELGVEIGELTGAKNEAYGSSFSKCGEFLALLYPDGLTRDHYDDALLLVRIFDKCMRIATRKDAFGESPYRDLAGYGMVGAVKDEVMEKRCPRCGASVQKGVCLSCDWRVEGIIRGREQLCDCVFCRESARSSTFEVPR